MPSFQPHEIEWTTEKSKRLWDYYGSNPEYRSAFFGHLAGRYVARRLMAGVAAADTARFLDFSCGHGDIIAACLPLMRGSQEMHAVDFSSTYVDAVNRRLGSQPHFKGATLVSGMPTAFPDRHFDVVFATEVIEHLRDEELYAMLVECKRILKPGGRVFLTTPNEENYEASKMMCPDCGCIYHKWQHVRVWSAASLQERMERAGLRTLSVTPVAWQSWRGKLLALLSLRGIQRAGLVYIGATAP